MRADSSTQRSHILTVRYALKMILRTQSRRNGRLLPGYRSAPSFWKRDAQPKRRPYIGKICGETVTMDGGFTAYCKRFARKARMSERRLSRNVSRRPGPERT